MSVDGSVDLIGNLLTSQIELHQPWNLHGKALEMAVAAALVAFTASVGSPFAALGGFVVLSLWLLDARFLRQERAFRRLFDSIRTRPPKEPGADNYFTMDVSTPAGRSESFLRVAVSLSLSLFYIPLLILVGVAAGIALS